MKRSGSRQRRLPERLLLVLAAAGRPLSLRELANAAGVYDSSARYAVVRLVERNIVRHTDGRYSLTAGGELLDFELRHSIKEVGAADAMRLIAAPNSSVVFVSLRRGGGAADVVLSQVVEPSDVLRFRELAKRYLRLDLREHEYRELQGTTVHDQAALGRLRQEIT